MAHALNEWQHFTYYSSNIMFFESFMYPASLTFRNHCHPALLVTNASFPSLWSQCSASVPFKNKLTFRKIWESYAAALAEAG